MGRGPEARAPGARERAGGAEGAAGARSARVWAQSALSSEARKGREPQGGCAWTAKSARVSQAAGQRSGCHRHRRHHRPPRAELLPGGLCAAGSQDPGCGPGSAAPAPRPARPKLRACRYGLFVLSSLSPWFFIPPGCPVVPEGGHACVCVRVWCAHSHPGAARARVRACRLCVHRWEGGGRTTEGMGAPLGSDRGPIAQARWRVTGSWGWGKQLPPEQLSPGPLLEYWWIGGASAASPLQEGI